ncbi:MAG: mechanosensitive ion channel family protein [Candidatus Micrarchaeota archaeon]|nr:mechanosensitive ion channel family protein [Candidatus Micrarchaeota archaeon]MCX8154591.1 mechanosensitive ion channel family protein [Candidatus Micrarchaeota archaeon]
MITEIESIMKFQIFGNTIEQYLVFFVSIFITVTIFRIFKEIILVYLRRIAETSATKYDNYLIESISELKWPFYLWISLQISIQSLSLPNSIFTIVDVISTIMIAFYVSKAVLKFVELVIKDINNTAKPEDRVDENIIDLGVTIIRIVIIVLSIVTVLTNLGIDTTALITGLGIGGLAVAFAFQRIMEDVFAFFMIHIDKPVKKGEFVVVGNYAGTIERIGLKSTRIRSTSGEEIVVSNKDLLNSWINNFGRMSERRYIMKIKVAYDTPAEVLERIPQIIREEISSASQDLKINRVHFVSYGDYALIFEANISIYKVDYVDYLDVVQRINLNIKRRFDREGIKFAFPTQSLHIDRIQNNKV